MKRAINDIIYFLLLSPVLIVLFFVSRPREEVFWVSLGVGALTYLIVTNSFLHWAVPRRSRHVPSIFVCFLGALLVSLATGDGESFRNGATWLAGFGGAFVFLYVAVKIGVPTHVGILVNTESVSAHWKDGVPDVARGIRIAERMRARLLFYEPAFVNGNFSVWPEHFEIAQEGSVVWYIKGLPGTRVTIRFDRGFDPFSEPNGEPSVFEAVVPQNGPGIAVAGPVVQSGRGAYSITIRKPDDTERTFTVEGGGSQTKG